MRQVLVAVPINNQYGREVTRGICRQFASRQDWQLVMRSEWSTDAAALSGWTGDGMVVQFADPDVERAALAAACPVVNVSDSHSGWRSPSVYSDNRAIGRMAAEHFLSHGFRHLAFTGPSSHHYSLARWEGFRAAGEQAGVLVVGPMAQPPVAETSPELREWLGSLRRPVGLLAAYDAYARSLVLLCRELRLRVPDDVAVVGVDDDPIYCEHSDVPISAVVPDGLRIGDQAARLIISLVEGEPAPEAPIEISPIRLAARRSSDVFAIPDTVVARTVQWIHHNVGQPITVERAAQEMALSRRSLERRFRRALGRTIIAEIGAARVRRAKELLSDTDLPLTDVARGAGFSDPVLMARAFRQRGEASPSRYRRRHRGT